MTDEDTRRRLLAVAREAVAASAEGRVPEVPADAGAFAQGVFVTLRQRSDGDLRGCVGLLRPPTGGLARLVAEAARAAAQHDPRFAPVRRAEVPGLRLEISLLGPLAPLRPEAVEVGRHGLVLQAHGRRGLLLPQVPEEQGWDREAFLEGLCRKAGLPPGTWREPAAELLGFTAEVFGED